MGNLSLLNQPGVQLQRFIFISILLIQVVNEVCDRLKCVQIQVHLSGLNFFKSSRGEPGGVEERKKGFLSLDLSYRLWL